MKKILNFLHVDYADFFMVGKEVVKLPDTLIPHSKNIMPGFHINDVCFSKQEIKCLRLLIAGKTIKLIGQHLSLSPRTVEFYLDNIKRKLNVKTKSELIEKVVQCIWTEILL